MAMAVFFRFAFALLLSAISVGAFAAPLTMPVLYLQLQQESAPALSNLLPPPKDSGLRGAELGISDNNTTGRFLGQTFELHPVISASPKTLLDTAKQWVEQGNGVILADMPADTLQELMTLSSIKAHGLVINVGSENDELRFRACQTRLLHTLPSRAMRADALIQFLIAKRWNRWLLIEGQQPQDALFSEAIQRSAKRFGGKIVAYKQWSFDTDLRRSAQRELPLFTQGKDYDITLIADEIGDVGEYVLYNTWHPRPVAGTQGLTPVAWHRVIEQWGAAQLQNRFTELSDRWMNDRDYAAWIALRSIGEAVTRTNSVNASELYRTMLTDDFEVAGFKGRKLSFRQWNGQLRQPIPLVHPRALVTQSPQEGFLHPRTDLDTLGFDQRECRCDFQT